MQLVRETVGGEEYECYPLGEYMVRAPGICGGRPTFRYALIESSGALDQLAKGYRGRISRGAIEEAVTLRNRR